MTVLKMHGTNNIISTCSAVASIKSLIFQ